MKSSYQQFYNTVMEYYGEHGRHDLPWRRNQTPYRVAISEFMLQQTQATRVIPFFNGWIKRFPSWKALAEAPQSEVLRYWKGLGYNSRALRLHHLAQIVFKKYHGRLPQEYDTLKTLPGIGPYTAGAIRAFAYNLWTPIIETNIRRIFIHHFFEDRSDVDDREIMNLLYDMGEVEYPRTWYEALMDYGSTMPKRVQHNPNVRSKHYTKQSPFKGSDREIRGKIIEFLLEKKEMTMKALYKKLGTDYARYKSILSSLEREGFVVIHNQTIRLG